MIDLAHYQAPAQCLAGRNILVTGAGDGIGATVACTYAAHGATVILLGRTQSKLEQVHDRIVAAGCPQPLIQTCDLATAAEAEFEAMALAIQSELGCLHGLLHNAALLGPRTPLEQYPASVWQELIAVNLNACFLLSKTMIPVMREAPDASMLFTTSGVGRKGRAYWGAYAVSKFGIEGLMQVLADELGATSGIRVNCINPGATNTRMRREAYPAELPTSNPPPERIMPAYLYLMGADSIGLNGQSLNAQGG